MHASPTVHPWLILVSLQSRHIDSISGNMLVLSVCPLGQSSADRQCSRSVSGILRFNRENKKRFNRTQRHVPQIGILSISNWPSTVGLCTICSRRPSPKYWLRHGSWMLFSLKRNTGSNGSPMLSQQNVRLCNIIRSLDSAIDNEIFFFRAQKNGRTDVQSGSRWA
jgi:hypothetical protein